MRMGTSDCNFLRHPLLFQWPGMEKDEEIHHGTLDSSSVFMLLTPNSSSCRRRPKTNVLYAWLGRNNNSVDHGIFYESSKEVCSSSTDSWNKIITNLLDQVGLPVCVTVQV